MTSHRERRAGALEAIAHALLELAAIEREPDETTIPSEILVDRRNCEKELGITLTRLSPDRPRISRLPGVEEAYGHQGRRARVDEDPQSSAEASTTGRGPKAA